MLEERGITVVTCASGEKALSMIGEDRFDAIVSDLDLTGMSGVDVLEKVRESDSDLPFILMSEVVHSSSAVRALNSGAQGYMLKPLNAIDDLLASLCKSVERHRLLIEQRESELSLRESHDDLRALWVSFTRMQEKARSDLARELHDEIGQMLVALGISLAVIQNGLPVDTDASLFKSIRDSREQLRGLSERVRGVMSALRPPVLDDYGLVASLKWYAEQYSKRTGIPVEIRGDCARLPEDSEIALFRVAQEAMSNIAEHANATQVLITVVSIANVCRVTITDDGSGFELNPKRDRTGNAGLGLLTMRERVRGVGGQFAVKSRPGNGTQVVVEVESVCRPI